MNFFCFTWTRFSSDADRSLYQIYRPTTGSTAIICTMSIVSSATVGPKDVRPTVKSRNFELVYVRSSIDVWPLLKVWYDCYTLCLKKNIPDVFS